MSGDKECVKDSDRDKMSEDMMISLLTIWMMRVTLLDEVSSKMATMLLMNFFSAMSYAFPWTEHGPKKLFEC